MSDEHRAKSKRDCEDCGEPISLMQLLVDGKCWQCRNPGRINVDYSMRRGPHEAPWWCRDE